jgi:hypothetical protein
LTYGGQRDAVALTVAERWSPTTATSRQHSGYTVTLSGHVCTWAERDAVVGAAWMTDGATYEPVGAASIAMLCRRLRPA